MNPKFFIVFLLYVKSKHIKHVSHIFHLWNKYYYKVGEYYVYII